MIQLKIDKHLLIPFGTPKWDISKIRIAGVSTSATYFTSDTPCAHINMEKGTPLRLADIRDLFPQRPMDSYSAKESLSVIADHIKKHCVIDTDSEKLFFKHYFDYLRERVFPSDVDLQEMENDAEVHGITQEAVRLRWPKPTNDDNWVFQALFPLPQAHLYLHDPLGGDAYAFIPENMFKVDFAFWTGRQIVGVEIDGASHVGSREHVRKDRLMQRAGVHVVHILNDEVKEHGSKVIKALLPREISEYWVFCESPSLANPLMPYPF